MYDISLSGVVGIASALLYFEYTCWLGVIKIVSVKL
jgi:hypothetical protein